MATPASVILEHSDDHVDICVVLIRLTEKDAAAFVSRAIYWVIGQL